MSLNFQYCETSLTLEGAMVSLLKLFGYWTLYIIIIYKNTDHIFIGIIVTSKNPQYTPALIK